MNILEVQSKLRDLNDDQLKQEMMSPGVAPQFLVLSEMQRRQEIRNGGKPMAPDQPSMKDQAMQGLGGLPQAPPPGPPPGPPQGPPQGMPPQGAPPQGYAAGGIVRLAGGGPLDIPSDSVVPQIQILRSMTPEQLAAMGSDPRFSPALINQVQQERATSPGTGRTGPMAAPGLDYRLREEEAARQGRGAGESYPDPPVATPSVPSAPLQGPPVPRSRTFQQRAQRFDDPGAPAPSPIRPGDLSPQSLSDSPLTVQTLGEETPYRPPVVARPSVPPMQPPIEPTEVTGPGLPRVLAERGGSTTRIPASEIDAAMARMPRHPATRTAMQLESDFDPKVVHPGGGTIKGVLGIGDAMWKDYAERLGLTDADRTRPEAQRMIYETFSEDRRKLNPKATDADIYTDWALGTGASGAMRRNPTGDAEETYRGLMGPKVTNVAFSTNGRLLQPGRTNQQTLDRYRDKWDRAAGGLPGLSSGGPGYDGESGGRRVAPAGSGAAAVNGNSSRPAVVEDREASVERRPIGDYAREADSATPDRFAGMEEDAKRLFGGEAGDRRSQNLGFALMQGGLAMAGSKSQYLATGISEGGLAGLASYRQGLDEARKTEREGFTAKLGIAGARGQRDASIMRTAGELSGQDSRERTAEKEIAARLRGVGMTNDTSLATTRMQTDASRDNAELQSRTQRDVNSNPAAVQQLKYILGLPPDQQEIALKTMHRADPERAAYYQEQILQSQRNGYSLAADRITEKHGPRKGEFLTPEEAKAKNDEVNKRLLELQKQYPTLFPQGGSAAPSTTLPAYDPKTGTIVRP